MSAGLPALGWGHALPAPYCLDGASATCLDARLEPVAIDWHAHLREPKRRSKAHWRYVTLSHLWRSPSHAHHIRVAKSTGGALKVSDEFTATALRDPRSQNHATGNEWLAAHRPAGSDRGTFQRLGELGHV